MNVKYLLRKDGFTVFNFNPIKKHRTLFLILPLLSYVLNGKAQEIPLEKQGYVDVYYVYGNPSYVTIPQTKKIEMSFGSQSQYNYGLANKDVLPNFSSLALRFRTWTILNELVMHPTLVWSLNKKNLQGAMYTVSFEKISKYPDLVLRYNSIAPLNFRAIVGMGLNPEEKFEGGAYAWFKVEGNDVLIEPSETIPYSFPTAPLNSGLGMRVKVPDSESFSFISKFEEFQVSEKPQDIVKYLIRAKSIAPFAWWKLSTGVVKEAKESHRQNIYLDVTWPLKEIDKIHELYLKYEGGEKVPSPLEEAQKEINAKGKKTYTANDTWSMVYEDNLKQVEPFSDNPSKTIGLKSGNRVTVSYNSSEYLYITPLIQTEGLFFIKKRTGNSPSNDQSIIDKRGGKKLIGGYSEFYNNIIENGKSSFIVLLSQSLYSKQKINASRLSGTFYKNYNEAEAMLKDKSGSAREGVVYLGIPHTFGIYKVRRIYVDSKLNVLSQDELYMIV